MTIGSFSLGVTNYLHKEKIRVLRERLEMETERRIRLEEQNIELMNKWKDSLENCQEFTSRFWELAKKANILDKNIKTIEEKNEVISNQNNNLDNIDSQDLIDSSSDIVDKFHKFNNELENLLKIGKKSVESLAYLESNDFLNENLNNFEPFDTKFTHS